MFDLTFISFQPTAKEPLYLRRRCLCLARKTSSLRLFASFPDCHSSTCPIGFCRRCVCDAFPPYNGIASPRLAYSSCYLPPVSWLQMIAFGESRLRLYSSAYFNGKIYFFLLCISEITSSPSCLPPFDSIPPYPGRENIYLFPFTRFFLHTKQKSCYNCYNQTLQSFTFILRTPDRLFIFLTLSHTHHHNQYLHYSGLDIS